MLTVLMFKKNNFPVVVDTDKGKIAVKSNAEIIPAFGVCQKCGSVLGATDLLDYICMSCERK